jgi:hypothetical protein
MNEVKGASKADAKAPVVKLRLRPVYDDVPWTIRRLAGIKKGQKIKYYLGGGTEPKSPDPKVYSDLIKEIMNFAHSLQSSGKVSLYVERVVINGHGYDQHIAEGL